MKYLKKILIVLFLFPLSVYADEGNVLIECPKNVKSNIEVECKITGSSSFFVSGIELEYSLPKGIKKTKTKVHESWEGTEEDNLFLLYTDKNKGASFDIGSIFVKSDKDIDEIKIDVKYLTFGDKNFEQIILIPKENVKNVVNENERKETEKNNYFKYVIIIMIIGIIASCVIYKTRSGKK